MASASVALASDYPTNALQANDENQAAAANACSSSAQAANVLLANAAGPHYELGVSVIPVRLLPA